MKKKITVVILLGLIVGLLCGCEKTPDKSIIREKNKDNISNYESVEDTGTSIGELINAPEHYKNEVTSQDGVLTIDIDAEVVVPKVSSINTVKVSAKELDQEYIDTITKTFFEGGKCYNGSFYYSPTKAELEEQITYLKKCKAEGNMDPYDYGIDAEGNDSYDIDASIAGLEECAKNAPESIEKNEVIPAFGLPEYQKEDKKNGINDDYLYVEVEMDDNVYSYTAKRDSDFMQLFKVDIKRENQEYRDDTVTVKEWISAQYFLEGNEGDTDFSITEDELKANTNISYEDAKKIADSKIEGLDLEGMEMENWNYAMFYTGNNGVTKDNVKAYAYQFQYTRTIDGFPITYTIDYGGCVEDMDSTTVPWGYEVCDIIVSENGVEQFNLLDPYVIGDVQTENVKLMNFDDIIGIYEEMMELSNASIGEYESKRIYYINRIELGYTRIYDPKSDNKSGVLVPVWDFFGGVHAESRDGYISNEKGVGSQQSYMTINAVDGTVINRGLGY